MKPSPPLRAHLGVLAVALVIVASVPLSMQEFDWVAVIGLGGWLMTTAVVGGLVLAGRPGNAVGPLMIGAAFAVAVSALMLPAYAEFALEQGHPQLPLARVAAWATLWATLPAFSLFVHLFLRFPSGRVPSPNWRWVSRLVTASVTVAAAGYALREGPIDTVPTVSNPAGGVVPARLVEIMISVGDTVMPLMGLLALVSLFVRFRRASRAERQQMKWFVFAVALFPVLFLLSQVVQAVDTSEEEYVGFLMIVAGLWFVPVSMGIGILKYRLYDIDVIVNRTLVYGALTAMLAATYLGLIVLLQRVLPVGGDSDIAVAASTLAVAGLFQPLRARVQTFIDHRFYRRKYDAAETLDRFSTRLRDEVELDALSDDLVAVVGQTMQPRHVSLWLREAGSR